MPLIQTALLTPSYNDPEVHQVYNGLDACLTLEIFNSISPTNASNPIYAFERALQAPALEMMLRGIKINRAAAISGIQTINAKIRVLDSFLQECAEVIWTKRFKTKEGDLVALNHASPVQLKDFLYHAMHLPEQFKIEKGVKKLSVDRECLEKLDDYAYARPIINSILQIRDLVKQREVFQTDIDNDGRIRCSFNIAGTTTGRWSSSSSSEDTGRNLQNIDEDLRPIFIADKGWKLVGIDLEQAESREVGWLQGVLFDRWEYLEVCYNQDLHTYVTKLAWPHLSWTGNKKEDRAVAETIFYRGLPYRFYSKKLGHGSNYFGKPPTLAKHSKLPLVACESFQEAYFGAFPGFPLWHDWVREQLMCTQSLTTIWGRERHFFGRPDDDSTLREAIAYAPQSSTADRLNLALWRIWRYMPEVKFLMQVHDALYFLMPETNPQEEQLIIKKALSLVDIRLQHVDGSGKLRELIVPGEVKVGYNWGNYATEDDVRNGKANKVNLSGLKKFDINTPLAA
jgi:DNA polymerase I-like protein with 3'-5' exonuclease and polymerase domains